ncbi:MerR family transcriptional regulator [Hymenobacter canadensis]|uniref:MerR family transcriptional regulator n=1 Tax=Hymenobacter canadensis TaxID=2999067 RepID=A0ABY7LP82_9BACT|nr:MerR family transcriptional regulator [Hymenobacter canadensis]WBA42231.1 MerR family transcriptional regulator [Hymenobacter canadensis]
MGHFSISDLEQLSGIKAHTIRIWEQRYGILRPVRTATNIRTYCDDDLRRLLNVATLCSRGYRISKVAQLSEQEMEQAVIACNDDANNYCQQVHALMAAMLAMDEVQLNQLLNGSIRRMGFEAAVLHIVYPFMQRIGVMWQAGSVNPAHEHLVTHLLRQKIMAATDSLPAVRPADVRRWVLFLPEGEMHELALLFMNFALRSRGHHVLYLGQNLPIDGLAEVCQMYQPHTVCTVLTAVPDRTQLQEFVEELRQVCASATVLLYGPVAQAESVVLPPHMVRLQMMTDFLAFADQMQEAVAEPA